MLWLWGPNELLDSKWVVHLKQINISSTRPTEEGISSGKLRWVCLPHAFKNHCYQLGYMDHKSAIHNCHTWRSISQNNIKISRNFCSLKWQRDSQLVSTIRLFSFVCCLYQSDLDRKLNRGERRKQSRMDVLIGGSDPFASLSVLQPSFYCIVTRLCGCHWQALLFSLNFYIHDNLLSLCASLAQNIN